MTFRELTVRVPAAADDNTMGAACFVPAGKEETGAVARNKKPGGQWRDRRGEVLFIDAGKLGSLVDRTRCEFSDHDIAKIAGTYHAWRGEPNAGKYEDFPGSLTHLVWTGRRGALNQHLFKVTSDRFPKWFYFYWIAEHMPAFQAIAASKATTMGHIQRHHLAEAMVTVPDARIMEAAEATIAPLFAMTIGNSLESRSLAKTRDLLLPKLMSGESRLRDAKKIVEAVA